MNWFKKIFTGKKCIEKKPDPVAKVYKESVDLAGYVSEGVCAQILDEALPEFIEVAQTTPPVAENIKPLDLMKVKYKASPNFSKRKKGEDPIYIVFHHTGPGSFNGIVSWLCNKDAKASAQYVVGTAAQITQLVSTRKEAWHVGLARHGKLHNNNYSIGIEICNIGRLDKGPDENFYYEVGRKIKKYTGEVKPISGSIVYPNGDVVSGYYIPYTGKQINKVVALTKALVKKYPKITRNNLLTHFQVATPSGRKNDPFGLDMEKIKDMVFGT